MVRDPDVAVIGSGPNGLVGAAHLARAGMRVLVLEQNPRRPGGCLGSTELTRPGFVHDVGAAFFPMKDSPALASLNLGARGLDWAYGRFDTCHPARDGTAAALSRDVDLTAAHLGSSEDGATWRSIVKRHVRIQREFDQALLGTFPRIVASLALLWRAPWLIRTFLSSSASLSRRWFETEAAQRVLPALAMHVDVGPFDALGAPLAYVLGVGASTQGFPIPVGGAQSIANALVTDLEQYGGTLELGVRVRRVVVESGRAVAVECDDGREVRVKRAVLADTSVQRLYGDLVPLEQWPQGISRKMRRFTPGPGTFKVDWALAGTVPWTAPAAQQSAVVHTGEDVDDLGACTAMIRSGGLPERPYLVIGQQSLFDGYRAPGNLQTLYCYTRVPTRPSEGSWETLRQNFADRIERRIEELAPGFRAKVLDRHITAPGDFEAGNPNLVGGDIGGGSNGIGNQLLFRPFFPYFRYATPIEGLYLGSSYTHPGAGVHGMCGYNAARRILRDHG